MRAALRALHASGESAATPAEILRRAVRDKETKKRYRLENTPAGNSALLTKERADAALRYYDSGKIVEVFTLADYYTAAAAAIDKPCTREGCGALARAPCRENGTAVKPHWGRKLGIQGAAKPKGRAARLGLGPCETCHAAASSSCKDENGRGCASHKGRVPAPPEAA